MIPTDILNEYNRMKALKFNAKIVKDNLRNTVYVTVISLDLHPNRQWLEVLK